MYLDVYRDKMTEKIIITAEVKQRKKESSATIECMSSRVGYRDTRDNMNTLR